VATTILAEQKSKVERFKSGDINKKTDLPYIVVILDDIISNDDLRYSESFNEFCFSGRHFNMFVVLCTQDVKVSRDCFFSLNSAEFLRVIFRELDQKLDKIQILLLQLTKHKTEQLMQ
jgi:hypothetical protein